MARASESVNTHGPINSLRLVHRWSEAAPLGGAGVGGVGGHEAYFWRRFITTESQIEQRGDLKAAFSCANFHPCLSSPTVFELFVSLKTNKKKNPTTNLLTETTHLALCLLPRQQGISSKLWGRCCVCTLERSQVQFSHDDVSPNLVQQLQSGIMTP